jgi:hypothetical protein
VKRTLFLYPQELHFFNKSLLPPLCLINANLELTSDLTLRQTQKIIDEVSPGFLTILTVKMLGTSPWDQFLENSSPRRMERDLEVSQHIEGND